LFVTVLLVADPQLVGQIVAGGLTAVASAGAAFLGAWSANRSTKVEDARAKETAEWERIERMITRACSTNTTEAYVGMYQLEKSKQDWNSNAEQVRHIRRTLDALTASAVQAYRGGQTTVVTSPPPSVPSPPSSPSSPGGP
jgi:hypothetical protein